MNTAKRKLILKTAIAFLCVALAICMYLCFSVSFYRARGIHSGYLSDTSIVLTPWHTFSCDLRGEKFSGNYKIVYEGSGDKVCCFYDRNGSLIFKALFRDKELIYDKTYFVRVN